jgi:DNA helicase II / ATP-dependent DNA helicase PcrA
MQDDLNREQREAVMCTEGPLLVLAGAGSGKTRVITKRIAYLVKEKGVDPYNILAITFTNKAAREMKDRVDSLLDGKTNGMLISTFHSACVRILRREIANIGYAPNFNIYDTADSTGLLKSIVKDLGLNDGNYSPKVLLAKFGALKDEMSDPDDYIDNHAVNFYEMNIGNIYREYQKRLKSSNSVDFDDIIFLTVKIFLENKAILEFYRERFRYILVDEYQDTNKLQFRLIDLLAGSRRNLCVVGDDDQSIFMWRGADIKNILSFESSFKGANVIKLEQNYRSTANILSAANDVISRNYSRKEKKLWTDKEDGANIQACRLNNEYQEGRYIADEIKRLINTDGYSYSDFAVLYRMNAQSRNIENALMAAGIPYRVFGSLEYYKRKEVKDLVSYLRIIYNEHDAVAFERAVSVPKRGVGGGTVEKAQKTAILKAISVLEAARKPDPLIFSRAQSAQLAGFASLIDGFREFSDMHLPSELIGKIIEDTGIIGEYKRTDPADSEAREENVREFVSIALQQERDGITSLSEFLENVSLISDTDDDSGSGMYVSVMTLHSSKGLEFPVVFISGFEEGIFPLERSLAGPMEAEEERRLCYVGMTRAKKILYLTFTDSRTIFGKTAHNRVSRFFDDISGPKIDIIGGDDQRYRIRSSPDIISKPKTAEKNMSGGLCEGDRVIHKRFGRGRVNAITLEDGDTILEIEFENKGKRRLMAAYADLEKM